MNVHPRLTSILKTAAGLGLMVAFISQWGLAQTEGTGITIFIQPHKVATDSLFGFRQDVVVEGIAEKAVGTIGSNIHIKGLVRGNITAIGGSVRLYKDAVVEGSIVCIGGHLAIHPEAQTPDPALGFHRVNYLDPSKRRVNPLQDTLKSKAALYLGQTFGLFLLTMLLFYWFPNQINEASFELVQDLVRPAIFGIITLAVMALGLLVSCMLMGKSVGFPMFLFFFCILAVIGIFGAAVLFYRLGQAIESLSKSHIPVFWGLLIAILAVGLTIHIPVVGNIVLFCFLIFGTGIVVATRFGTNKQWFTRKKRFWSAG